MIYSPLSLHNCIQLTSAFYLHVMPLLQIEVLRPMKSTRSVHNPSPEHEGFYLHAFYSYHDLPQRYWKKYQYASQFVGLVRAKTPKVTLYTDLAKCMLMENGGNPDYEACFYNGEFTLYRSYLVFFYTMYMEIFTSCMYEFVCYIAYVMYGDVCCLIHCNSLFNSVSVH